MAHHQPLVLEATRPARTDTGRRLLFHPRKPAAAHHRPPVLAATRPALTDKCRWLVPDHR